VGGCINGLFVFLVNVCVGGGGVKGLGQEQWVVGWNGAGQVRTQRGSEAEDGARSGVQQGCCADWLLAHSSCMLDTLQRPPPPTPTHRSSAASSSAVRQQQYARRSGRQLSMAAVSAGL
jgi:hypothetical protein